jgi:FixJ family two-component response regulator
VTQAPATIHIVDDDESLRTALMRLLRAAGYAVRTYASAGDFLLNKPANAPGCVVLDVRMPGPSGFELQEAIAKLDESLPIIFLTGHGDIPMSVRAIKAGAVDFLTKPVRKETLLQAVRTALAGSAERCATRELLHSLRSRYESLTPREREVFEQVASGKLNKQIAGELGTCERTVKAHRAHVMEKMQLTSVAELVHAADQLIGCGITTLPR